MSAVSQLLSGSTKAGVSAVSLLLLDKYNGAQGSVLSMEGIMRGGVQFLSSLWQNIVAAWIRPFLPTALQFSDMIFKPVVVGLQFAVLEMIINGERSGALFKYDFIVSTLAEVASQLVSPTIAGLTMMGSSSG